MRKSIVIGSDRDLRSWLFEAEEAPAGGAAAGGAPAGGAPAGYDAALSGGSVNIAAPFTQGDKAQIKEGRLVYGFERRSSLPGIRRRY